MSDRDWLLIIVALNAVNVVAALFRTWLQWRQRR
jgi:hypothetical protein